jgi:hypothetical protein
MAPFETSCPRCMRLKAFKKTRRLPDLRTMATQYLVKLEQCPNCKFMVFPGESHCSSCGAGIVVASAKSSSAPKQRVQRQVGDRARLVVGIVLSAVTLGVVLFLFHSFRPR